MKLILFSLNLKGERKMGIRWILFQKWEDICFFHWPIDPKIVEQSIPTSLQLDLFNGTAWISVVLFKVKENRLRNVPSIPFVNSLLQVNVRTYVEERGRKGVYFLSVDMNNTLLAKLNSIGNYLPSRYATMKMYKSNKNITISSYYISKFKNESIDISISTSDEKIEKNSLDCWLLERYHCWSITKMDKLIRTDIKHVPWELRKCNATINQNTMCPTLMDHVLTDTPVVHYSKAKDCIISAPVF